MQIQVENIRPQLAKASKLVLKSAVGAWYSSHFTALFVVALVRRASRQQQRRAQDKETRGLKSALVGA